MLNFPVLWGTKGMVTLLEVTDPSPLHGEKSQEKTNRSVAADVGGIRCVDNPSQDCLLMTFDDL